MPGSHRQPAFIRCPVRRTPPPAAPWADLRTAGTPGAAAPGRRSPVGAARGPWSGSAPERGDSDPAGSRLWGRRR